MDKQIAKIEKKCVVTKKLVNIRGKRTIIFLDIPIEPIAKEFQDSLESFLSDEIWGEYCDVQESIFVTDLLWRRKDDPCLIRYQFGDLDVAALRMDYISELIEEKFIEWVERNGGYEAVCPSNI